MLPVFLSSLRFLLIAFTMIITWKILHQLVCFISFFCSFLLFSFIAVVLHSLPLSVNRLLLFLVFVNWENFSLSCFSLDYDLLEKKLFIHLLVQLSLSIIYTLSHYSYFIRTTAKNRQEMSENESKRKTQLSFSSFS